MQIGKPSFKKISDTLRVEYQIVSKQINKILWFEVDNVYSSFVSDLSDAALMSQIVPAMISNEEITVKGRISTEIAYRLPDIQSIINAYMQEACIIPVHVDQIEDDGAAAHGVATGLTGGVDSFCVINDHYWYSKIEKYKLTHLLFNNVGSHSLNANCQAVTERLFQERSQRMDELARRVGLKLIKVNSNVNEFYDRSRNYVKTHGIRDAVIALLLQNGIGKWMYASGVPYTQTKIDKAPSTAYSEPVLLPMLRTSRLELLPVGGSDTRVEKTLRIAAEPIVQEFLDVCAIEGKKNCSHCAKCMRTMLTIEIAGLRHLFQNRFDWEIYETERNRFVSLIYHRHHKEILLKEIKNFADRRKFRMPVVPRLLPPMFYTPKRLAWLWANRKDVKFNHYVPRNVGRIMRAVMGLPSGFSWAKELRVSVRRRIGFDPSGAEGGAVEVGKVRRSSSI